MISSNLYNYVDILDKAADAGWLRQQAISNNIANQDTPRYKRQDVNFEGVLERELGKNKYVTLDEKVRNINMNHLNAEIYVDSPRFDYWLDENNVDPEQEYVQLASAQIKYNALIDSMNEEFSRIKSVIK